ncbi:MAG: glycosyltransferase [Coriobacteriia bacterium]|nr:glycosyltransferase [Coriobacteriia bacterium]
MRVLVIPSWYPSDTNPTAGIFIQQQVQALSDAGLDVAVLHVEPGAVAFEPTTSLEDGATVVRAGIVASGAYERYFGYRKAGQLAFDALRAGWGDPDIVHVQALWPAGLIARDIKRSTGIPFVVTEHSEEYLAHSKRRLVRTPGMLPLVLRPLAREASAYIAVSRFLADRLVELGLTKNPVVIPNVVPDCQAQPTVFEAPHVIAHVSVMGPAKNLDSLLRATDILRRERDDFIVSLAGDGECREELMKLSEELGLGGMVEFPGRIPPDGIPELLGRSAFAVLSSSHETFSVWAAESIMCGRPVVSTRCGGPEEFVTPEVGRLVAADSDEALAEGLGWMLDHFGEFDPAALHGYARERFAPDAVAARIASIYASILRP